MTDAFVRPASRTLPELLVEIAARCGDELAIVSRLGDRTYNEVEQRAAIVRAGLRERGVGRRDTVALLAPNSPDWIAAAFGILGTGARLAAFNTWVKAWDLEYLLAHSSARTMIMAPSTGRNDLLAELRSLVPELWAHPPGRWRSARFPDLRDVVVIGEQVPQGAVSWVDFLDAPAPPAGIEQVDPAEIAYVLYTSGSTAHPKAVPLVHSGLIENGFNIGERVGIGPEDRVWLAAPLFWSFGAANALMATFSHGATLILESGFVPDKAAEQIAKQRCTVAYLLPTMASGLYPHGSVIRAAGSLRKGVMIGRPEELRRAVDELGISALCNIYGSTETYGNCCVTPHDMPLERRLESQGPPLPGVELRIVDPDSREPLARGLEGEIEVRGYVTPGYLGDPVATARALTEDGWYRTGDLGSLDESGWLTYTGRASDMIKSSGINVSPAEVERFIDRHPDVLEVVVVGTPHSIKGEVAVAFVRIRETSVVSGDEIRAFCKASIAGYKVPEVVVLRDTIPKTDTGKVARRLLADEAAFAVSQRPESVHAQQ